MTIFVKHLPKFYTDPNLGLIFRRHKEFLAKYFAEQDKQKPRRLSILLKEVEREENERKFYSTRTTRNARKRILLGHDSPDAKKLDRKVNINHNKYHFLIFHTVKTHIRMFVRKRFVLMV